MNTLSIFPDLLTFSMAGPVLLRIAVVIFVANLAKQRIGEKNILIAVPSIVVGLLLVLGLYTQVAAILGILVISGDYMLSKASFTFSWERKILYGVIKLILLSLLLTGPGFLAFDLPL